ncbi:MAG TPA: bifunctional adenosylcobinamide kinase/adenosylcobinamide-phosphate guanylyltransferase [Mycobacteriales bacterium]|nr:bifunctional adenosylcobinamide kinase/adenosylcobinamide-phosphate guanylyltransferase [Mycobacteriales bacterium]
MSLRRRRDAARLLNGRRAACGRLRACACSCSAPAPPTGGRTRGAAAPRAPQHALLARCGARGAAREQGVLRGQTGALVDGLLLVEIGAETPRAALRHGTTLADVDAVLVTHAHPDHHSWPAWMWRGWAAGRRPLTLVAPPAVLAAARDRLDDTVTTVEIAPGDHVHVAGYDVVALAARHATPDVGPAVLYDVTAPDGARLLWACDTGVLPDETLDAVTDRRYDAVVLELTSAHLPHHHDLRTWPEQVAELRRRGAVAAHTHVLAAHLGHDNPPPDELARVLAGWGARAPVDGEVVDLGTPPQRVPVLRRTLVLGGARSGKSAHAEQLLASEPRVTYVATAPERPGDDEWAARVRAHAARRPAGWRTVETGDVAAELRDADGAVLVDDLGLWLTRALDELHAWDGALPDDVGTRVDDLVSAWRDCRARAVLVAPVVGSGVVPATASGRRFRDLLGSVTARLSAESDGVVEVVAGLSRRLR